MILTLSEYLLNPYGRGSSFANVKTQIEDLTKQFKELDNDFIIKFYKRGSLAIIHVVVPSTHKEDVTYDVLYEFDLSKASKEDVTVDKIPMRVFSNCPSFIFTFANAFRKYGLLCKWLEDKYRPEVKKKTAEIKNQYNIIGLERSLYLSMMYISQHNYNVITVINGNATKSSSYYEIAKNVRSQDEIMEHYKSQIKKTDITSNPKEESTNKEDTKVDLNKPKYQPGRHHSTPSVKTVKSSKATKTTKSVTHSKTSKTVKSMRKI